MTENRKDCPMRHENGNCTVAGGFCTAVNAPICEALHNAFDCGYCSALRQQETVTKCNELNEPLKEFAEDVARQFAYRVKTIDGHAAYSTGGLSTLEAAFDILGWDEPHPCPECECEADGCHEWATCGTPTKDGYKWLCGKHFKDVQEESDHA